MEIWNRCVDCGMESHPDKTHECNPLERRGYKLGWEDGRRKMRDHELRIATNEIKAIGDTPFWKIGWYRLRNRLATNPKNGETNE